MSNKNKGNTLMILLIAILIIGVLGSAALYVANNNLKVEKSRANYSRTFSESEKAVNVIKACIEKRFSEIVNTEYNEVMNSYSYVPSSERNVIYRQLVFADLRKVYPYEINSYLADLDESDKYSINDTITIEETDNTFRIKDLVVTYTNSGNELRVHTDIVIYIRDMFSNKSENVSDESLYSEYALIADGNINYDVNSTLNINGSVYSGNGISLGGTAPNTNININANTVSTRQDISIYNGISLNLSANSVYAENIKIEDGTVWNTGDELSNIQIDGNTYVNDDLEINSEGASITLKGNYYGYGNDSSIILNKNNSNINLAELAKLEIVGNANISPSKTIVEEALQGVEIETSESVTSKFMQLIYLVPGQCISTKVNPTQVSKDSTDISIDYSLNSLYGGLDLLDSRYDIKDDPISITVPTQNVSLRYYYLDFNSKKGQINYVNDYISMMEEYITDRATKLMLQSYIKTALDSTLYITDGNILDYGLNESGDMVVQLYSGLGESGDEYLSSESDRITLEANCINSDLTAGQKINLTDSLFNSVINTEKIKNNHRYTYYTLSDLSITDIDSDTKQKINNLGSDIMYDIVVTNGDFTVPMSMTNGLVIATGNVNIGHDFLGTIISGGNIEIAAGCSISSGNDEECPLLWILNQYKDANSIRELFRQLELINESDDEDKNLNDINIKEDVSYDNWMVY